MSLRTYRVVLTVACVCIFLAASVRVRGEADLKSWPLPGGDLSNSGSGGGTGGPLAGTTLWTSSLTGDVKALVGGAGSLYVGTGSGVLYRLSSDTGRILWEEALGGAVSELDLLTDEGAPDMLLVRVEHTPFRDSLAAIDPETSLTTWQYPANNASLVLGEVTLVPREPAGFTVAFPEGSPLPGNVSAGIRALDSGTGNVLWHVPEPDAAYGGRAVVEIGETGGIGLPFFVKSRTTPTRALRVYDAFGGIVSETPLDRSPYAHATSIKGDAGGQMVFTFPAGEVGPAPEVLSIRSNGTLIWRTSLRWWGGDQFGTGTFDVSVSVGDCGGGRMVIGIVADSDGGLTCLNMATGVVLWEVLTAPHRSRPLLVDLTGDGEKDILASTWKGVILVSLRDGGTVRKIDAQADIMVPFDADGDGRIDLVLANGTTVQVIRTAEPPYLIALVLALLSLSVVAAVWWYRSRRARGSRPAPPGSTDQAEGA